MEKNKKDNLIIKFAHEDGYVIKYANKLPYFLKSNYGLSSLYKKLIFTKIERLRIIGTVDPAHFAAVDLKFFRFYIPNNKDLRYRYYAHLYFLFFIKVRRAYRHLLGLPTKGQRT